jgi:GDP-4-dehydro-6-deoxy-D-mannose reductase
MIENQPTILVTGGTGFAGSHLIEELLTQGYTNIYSTTFSKPDDTVRFLPESSYKKVDLSDPQATQDLFAQVKPDWVFHLASFAYVGKSFEKARELFGNNIGLQLSVLDAIHTQVPQARVLTIGSAEEYGIVGENVDRIDEDTALNPVNPYAVSKVTQDLLAQSYVFSYQMNIIRARPFNHIGVRQTGDFAIPAFVNQIIQIERGTQDKLHVGNLEGIRDFTSADDMVKAYILLMEKGVVGEVYNIGSGKGWKMNDVVEMLLSLANKPITVEADPQRFRPLDVPKLIADNKKMVALGWQPTIDIKPTLQEVLEEGRKK